MLDYNKILMVYENHWTKVLKPDQAKSMKKIAKIIKVRAYENGEKLSGVSVMWPEDFDGEKNSLFLFLEDFKNQINGPVATSSGLKITFK